MPRHQRGVSTLCSVFLLFCATALPLSSIKTGSAATQAGFHTRPAIAALLRTLHPAEVSGVGARSLRFRPLSYALPTGDVTSAAVLQIPWNAWPSGTANSKGAVLTPTQADNTGTNFFAYSNFHRQSYIRHGMKGGYFQQADLALNKKGDTLQAYWLGSYYNTAADAAGRVADSVNTMHLQGFREQSCYLPDQPNCTLFLTGPAGYILYAVWSDGNVVGEIALLDSKFVLEKNTSIAGTDLQTLLKAADATVVGAVGGAPATTGAADSPPAEPSVSVTSVDLWHYASGKLVKTPTLTLHETAYFVAQFQISAIGVYSASGALTIYSQSGKVVMIEHKLKKPDKTVFDGKGSLGIMPDGTVFFDAVGTFDDPADEGSLTVQITVTQHNASSTKSLDFTLQKQTVHCKKGYRAKFGTCFKKK